MVISLKSKQKKSPRPFWHKIPDTVTLTWIFDIKFQTLLLCPRRNINHLQTPRGCQSPLLKKKPQKTRAIVAENGPVILFLLHAHTHTHTHTFIGSSLSQNGFVKNHWQGSFYSNFFNVLSLVISHPFLKLVKFRTVRNFHLEIFPPSFIFQRYDIKSNGTFFPSILPSLL